MFAMIPLDQRMPISLSSTVTLFTGCPFTWCLAGGYAIEQFLGKHLRDHEDVDILVLRHEQLRVQAYLKERGWRLFAADPPGTLREWKTDEYLSFDIHDIWLHHQDVSAWQLQLMLAETDGHDWVFRRDPSIRGKLEDLIVVYHDLPCVRVDVQLMYKARTLRPKDQADFEACLPDLTHEQKQWLREKLSNLFPQGHLWIPYL